MLLEGQQFGQYRILQQLNSGDIGKVYLAVDEFYHRHVAIKVIQASSSLSSAAVEEAIQYFLCQIQAVAQIEHRHILPIYNSGEEYIDGITLTFMVMPFCEEGSLFDWLHKPGRPGMLWPTDVEHIVKQVASALQNTHNKNILHRNIKPSNLLVCDQAESADQLKLQLADFGVAHFMTTFNKGSTMRSMPMNLAPEQWEGQYYPETDQFALAAMAYELLTGCPPFIGSKHRHTWYRHPHEQAKPPSIINPQIPKELDTVLLRALSKKPNSRYSSMAAFARAFSRANDSHGNIIRIKPRKESGSLEDPLDLSPAFPPPRVDNVVPLPSHRQHDGIRKYPIKKYMLFSLLLPLILLSLILGSIGIISHFGPGQTALDQANKINANSPTSEYTAAVRTNPTNISGQSATAYATKVTSGALIINDPLHDNSQNYGWDTLGIQGGGGCSFYKGAYYSSMPQKGFFSPCFAEATNFTDFAYQIQMTIVKGDQGGIAFRANPANGSFYYFHINRSGAYALEIYTDYNSTTILSQGSSPAIKTGLHQTNLIAVVANGNNLVLYVNMRQITSLSNGIYSQGQIGVIAENVVDPTTVIFCNAEVWAQ